MISIRQLNQFIHDKEMAGLEVSRITISREDFNTLKKEVELRGLQSTQDPFGKNDESYFAIQLFVDKEYLGPPRVEA